MTMIAILDELTESKLVNVDNDNEPDHLYCECDENISLCGMDITDYSFTPGNEEIPDEKLCVVCDDLVNAPCRLCGKE